METLNASTGHEWNDLPLFAEGIPVNLSAKQVIAKVKKILATCGLGYDKPLASFDPITQSWRMSAGIFPSGEQPSLLTLPPSGMTRSGALFQQPAWEPLTGATESSLWPTPTAVIRPMEGNVRLYRAKVEAGEMTEQEAEAILGKSVWEAQGKIPAKWPTPTYGKLVGGTGGFNQIDQLYSMGQVTLEEKKAMQAGNGGKLNPMWVEWLMGFPPGWTDLED